MDSRVHYSMRNWGCRIRDVLFHDIRTVIVENELVRLAVLAGKGTDIVELNYKPRDLDFAWLTPRGVKAPTSKQTESPSSAASFLDSYPGGWQEVFPNGGAASAVAGAEFGVHGELYALPWTIDVIEDREEAIAVRFSVRSRKTPCLIQKTLRMEAGTAGFRLEERLVNESPVDIPCMWGHHITFGQPFLRAGCRIRVPDGLMVVPHPVPIAPSGRRLKEPAPFPWPMALGADDETTDFSLIPERGTKSDQFYLHGFSDANGWYEVVDGGRAVGARIAWDATVMPYLWYWQEFGSHLGYPWYGRSYNIGLEPFSSYPNTGLEDAIDNGSALRLAPGEDRSFWLTMSILDETNQLGTPLLAG